MLLMIAFLMFAALFAAWIIAPNTTSETMPETEIAPKALRTETSATPA